MNLKEEKKAILIYISKTKRLPKTQMDLLSTNNSIEIHANSQMDAIIANLIDTESIRQLNGTDDWIVMPKVHHEMY